MKEKMKPKLLPNEEEIKKELEKMNSLDLELYDYAQSLMSFRLKHIIPIVEKVRKIIVQQQVVRVKAGEDLAATAEDTNALQCPVSQSDIMTRKKVMTTTYKNSLGVHQPPGHKGP